MNVFPRTNLPKEIMCYPDYPFPDYPESYVKSGKVLKYLEDFATKFELRKYIKVNKNSAIYFLVRLKDV
jgi:dimethylaniline monooxygenase (N-oxide forming)